MGLMEAAVAGIVPKQSRATGYGIFECAFGVFWFLGSWILGVLYDVSIPAMIALSVAAQLAAIPLYLASAKRKQNDPANKVDQIEAVSSVDSDSISK